VTKQHVILLFRLGNFSPCYGVTTFLPFLRCFLPELIYTHSVIRQVTFSAFW